LAFSARLRRGKPAFGEASLAFGVWRLVFGVWRLDHGNLPGSEDLKVNGER